MIELHVHIHVEGKRMKRKKHSRRERREWWEAQQRRSWQPVTYIHEVPLLGQMPAAPATLPGQWGQELPQPAAMATPPWLEVKPVATPKDDKVIRIPHPNWTDDNQPPRQFARSA